MKDIRHRQSIGQSNSGFTLIELLITLTILSVLAAIAVPSYQKYRVNNAEAQVQAKMKSLSVDLERWKSTSLTYKGFKPKQVANDGTVTYSYDEADDTTIYVPAGSDSTNYSYKITLDDASSAGNSLSGNKDLSSVTVGQAWRMFAEPENELSGEAANKMLLKSDGTECKSSLSSFIKTSSCTGTGISAW